MPPKRGILVRFQSGDQTALSPDLTNSQTARHYWRNANSYCLAQYQPISCHRIEIPSFLTVQPRPPSFLYRQIQRMALTDTFVRQVKLVKKSGDKYSDGDGMYLLVLASGKYWRMD